MSVAHSQEFGFMEASPDAQPAFAPCHGADEEPSLPHVEVNCSSGDEQTQARKLRKISLNPLV